VEQFGVQAADDKDPRVPDGRPETDRDTGWVVPDIRLRLIVLVNDEPAVAYLFPELESTKSKGFVTVVPVILSVKLVLRVTPGPIAVILMG
jgi:hypothetical protein